ncbi:MAG: DNA polymerase [Candidatus Paceibacterota bacterium]
MSKKDKRKIILFDSHAIIHRAYHALPDFSSSKGEPTGALYGLSSMLMAIINEFKPDFMVAAFDLPKPTYRHEAYADYKSGRKALDENLSIQLKRARDIFKAFGIPIYEAEGFEADDIIGTAVEQLQKDSNNEIIIASGDMDTLQLVYKKQVKVFTLRKGIKDTILYDEDGVFERYNFKPNQLIDFKGLRGDPSDNIIGVPGIGEKTATTLLQTFGTIEKIYAAIEKDSPKFKEAKITPRILELLKEHKEEAEFSKMLATIRRDAPVEIEVPEKSWIENIPAQKIKTLFNELEFRSLAERFNTLFSTGETETVEEKVEQVVDEDLLQEAKIGLWLLNSNLTNPSMQDVLHFARTELFESAHKKIIEEVEKHNMKFVFDEIEKPLIPILKKMEEKGIAVLPKVLKELSNEYHKKLNILEKEIYKMAGEEFNINSPKQMAEVLFVKMELKYPGMRKTSTGAYSTKEDVLQKLLGTSPIIDLIMDYRELSKLVSTYIDKIPNMIAKDGRLHPKFIQTGAATGRMSSQDPNIQNIPIKTDNGRRIRTAFVAPKGRRFLACDYSQIELRLAAIFSGDEKFVEAFRSGKDIHSSVASLVFGVPENEITKMMRVKAKTINFGILYGMGVVALQKNLKTERKEAQKFYDDYFETFTTLANYLEETKSNAKINGYVETLFGRRRHLDGIKSSLPFIRAQAERMAINAPIQGTSADITKLAMVHVAKWIEENKLNGKIDMLLQIHDELIFEIDEDEIEKLAPQIKKIMENVLTEEQKVGVPIIVECAVGKSWGEMKSL